MSRRRVKKKKKKKKKKKIKSKSKSKTKEEETRVTNVSNAIRHRFDFAFDYFAFRLWGERIECDGSC